MRACTFLATVTATLALSERLPAQTFYEPVTMSISDSRVRVDTLEWEIISILGSTEDDPLRALFIERTALGTGSGEFWTFSRESEVQGDSIRLQDSPNLWAVNCDRRMMTLLASIDENGEYLDYVAADVNLATRPMPGTRANTMYRAACHGETLLNRNGARQ